MILVRKFVVLLLLPAVLGLVSCSPEDKSIPAASQALLEVPRPGSDTMQGDVAALVNERWEELDAALSTPGTEPEELAEIFADFGLACFGNGLVIPAEAAFENATRLVPGDARWIYFLALVREFTGSLEEAGAGLEQVLALRPDDLPALIHLGDVRFEQARMKDARTAFGRVLVINPESAAARYGLGRVASAEGNDEEAIDHFETALVLQPNADRLNYLLGVAWRNLGDQDKAKAFFEKRGTIEPSFADPLFDEISGGQARVGGLWTDMNEGSQAYVDGDYVRAVEKFRAASQNHPDDPRSWQSLGMALKSIGNVDAAEDAYLNALALDESNAVVHLDLAMLMIGGGRVEAAQAHLNQAIAIDPRNVDTHVALAGLLIGMGRLSDALVHYNEALTLDPQSGELAISRAEVLIALDRSGEALDALAEAVRVNPLDATVRTTFGMMLFDAGRTDAALAEVNKALEVADDDVARARAHFALGRINATLGNAGAAVSSFETAVALSPGHRAARLELARALVRSRQYEQALAAYQVLLERVPDNERARIEAAGTALLVRQPVEARRLLEEGAARESASPQLLSALARLLALARNADVRDPDKALDIALRAFESSRSADNAETVALCLAAVGRFEEAIDLQQQLLDEVTQRVDASEQARLEGNLAAYRSGKLGRLPLDNS